MKKKTVPVQEDQNAGDDFEAFEEWEDGPLPEAVEGDKALPEDGPQEFEEPLPERAPKQAVSKSAPSEGAPASAADNLAGEFAALGPDVPVNLVAVIGKTQTNVGELVKYRLGQVIDLGRPPGETVDLVANGRLIARGELVEMEGKLAVRILKMVR